MAYLLTLILSLIIAWTTLTSSAPGPPGGPWGDKAAHGMAFVALAAPLAWRYPRRWWAVAAAVTAYGGLIEIVQPHVGRSMELADLLADAAGAVCGAWLGAVSGRLWRVVDQ